MTAAGIARRRFPRSTEQSPGQRKSHERRSAGGEVQGVVPVGGRTEQHVVADARFKNDLLKNLTVVRREHSQTVPIKNVNDALLAAGDQFVGIGAVLIGKDEGAGGTQVKIVGVEVGHAPRSEIIGDREIGGKLQHAVAIGLATVWDIEPIAAGFGGLYEDVAIGIGRETDPGLPNGSQSVVGRGVKDGELRQIVSVVGKNPAGGAVVAGVRAEAQVQDSVEQQEAGAVFLMQAVEDGEVSFITCAGGSDQDGAARLLVAGGDIEGVKMVTDGGVETSLGHQIHGVGGRIDNRG